MRVLESFPTRPVARLSDASVASSSRRGGFHIGSTTPAGSPELAAPAPKNCRFWPQYRLLGNSCVSSSPLSLPEQLWAINSGERLGQAAMARLEPFGA